MLKLKPETLAVLCTVPIGITTVLVSPNNLGSIIGFTGGLVGGASVATLSQVRKQKREEDDLLTSQRVTSCFTVLYETNKGLVDPIQLAYHANIELGRAHEFLHALAETTNGSKIATPDGLGVVFNFSHANNVLNNLTKNAQAWVQAQTAELQNELNRYQEAAKQAAQIARLQQAAATANAMQSAAQAQVPTTDPWGQLNQ